MEAPARRRPHVVLLPFAQQGHINPFMQLAKTLAARDAQATVVLPENTARAAVRAPATPNLRIVGLPDNLPPERSTGSSFEDSLDSMTNLEASFSHFLRHLQPPASSIIYDGFMAWLPSVASALSIPCILFFTSNASACLIGLHIPSLEERGVLPFRPDGDIDSPLPTEKVTGLAGLPDLLPEDFPICITFDRTHFRYKFVQNSSEKLHDASAIILNAVQELEPEAFSALKVRKHVFVVGPLLLMSDSTTRLDVNYWPEEDHCLSWLDTQAPSSVLFVSFGSVASSSVLQFQELANGLDASQQPFLWVVRADSVGVPVESALPDGFRERTKERGMIISWGPQLLILSHPSIGGFLTQGGWNSIIENISLGSVPMICWPHVAEQTLNRLLVVDQWKMGLRLQHAADGSVSKEEIERVVRDLFQGKQSMDLKEAAKKVGDLAKAAVVEGGCSQKCFEDLYSLL